MLKIVSTKQFKKDFRRSEKQVKDLTELKRIIDILAVPKELSAKNYEHALKGNYKDCMECHISPDWLLIYQQTAAELILIRLGSHSELFK